MLPRNHLLVVLFVSFLSFFTLPACSGEKGKAPEPAASKAGTKAATGELKINPNLPTVVIVTTGGTIAEKTDPKTGGAVPAVSGSDLVKAVPGLGKVANIKVIDFSDIDSSQMTPKRWYGLSKTVDQALSDSSIT